MTTTLTPVLRQQFFDNNGIPLVGGKLYSYAAGSTTPLATYTDSTGGTSNTNPLVLDARGSASVWIPVNTAYKFNLTDANGNQIPGFPIDQVTSSQLVTLYGGVDTGSANAYVINFTANFSSLADGIIVYWIPANTNTMGSTINVNSLGAVTILNEDGTALTAYEIIANRRVGMIYKSGNWYLITPWPTDTGSWTTTLSGPYTSNPTGTLKWRRQGNLAFVWADAAINGTATGSSQIYASGLPAEITPANDRYVACVDLRNNSGNGYAGLAWVVAANNVIEIFLYSVSGSLINNAGFTGANNCGINSGWVISYPIS